MFYGFSGIRSKVLRDFLKVCRSTKTTYFEAQLEQRLELFYLEHIIRYIYEARQLIKRGMFL